MSLIVAYKSLMQELEIKISDGLGQQTQTMTISKIKRKADRKGIAKQIVHLKWLKITWTPLF